MSVSACVCVCVCDSPRANEPEFELNLCREGIISSLVVMEMRCLLLAQWIVDSDALMVWVENSLTYIQAGAERAELTLISCHVLFFFFSSVYVVSPYGIVLGGCAVRESFIGFTWCFEYVYRWWLCLCLYAILLTGSSMSRNYMGWIN